MKVIDASVALKWIIPQEEDSETALEYLEQHIKGEMKIRVPELFYSEIANVLATKKEIPLPDAIEAFQLIWNLDISPETFDVVDHLECIGLADKLKISTYDASYVMLAGKLNADLITADKKLVSKCNELEFVKLL